MIYENSQKNAIELDKLPLPAVTFDMLIYQNMYMNQTQSVKIWWRYTTLDMNARQICIKIPKKNH